MEFNQRGIENQRSQELSDIEAQKRQHKEAAATHAKEQEEHLDLTLGEQLQHLEAQLGTHEAQMQEIQSQIEDPETPNGKRRKLRNSLEKMHDYQRFLEDQVFRTRTRMESSKKLIQYQLRTRKELIDTAFATEKSLLLKRYSEIFLRLIDEGLIADVQSSLQLDRQSSPGAGNSIGIHKQAKSSKSAKRQNRNKKANQGKQPKQSKGGAKQAGGLKSLSRKYLVQILAKLVTGDAVVAAATPATQGVASSAKPPASNRQN